MFGFTGRVVLLIMLFAVATPSCAEQPNVLFISIDDLNDWVGVFGGHDQVKTPNLDRFAREGSVIFQNAHCPGSVCGSCRSALLSGFMPHRTGIYGNGQNMRGAKLVQQYATLPEYFSKNGYHTVTRGKIFHRHGSEDGWDAGQWAFDEFHIPKGGTPVDRSKITSRNKNLVNGVESSESKYTNPHGTEFAWGPTRCSTEETKDFLTAEWAANELQKQHAKPFFMAVGISRPHLPFFVPQEFFDLYDPKTFRAPPILETDLEDILVNGKRPKHRATPDYLWLKEKGLIDECALAYAAACSFADACLGKIFEGLEKSPYKDNTIVVVWGDHGWHLGEKLRYRKTTGWYESTRVPFLIRLPSMATGTDCKRPVNLIDIYPTLVELCNLPGKPSLDGRSLKKLLENPSAPWEHPSLTVFGGRNVSINGERFHYLKYSDGTEEFYDRQSDPMEWTNLIDKLNQEQVAEKERLSKYVPAEMAEPLPNGDPKFKKVKQMNRKAKSQRDLSKLK